MNNHDEKLLTHFRGYLIGRGYTKAQKALAEMMYVFNGELRKDGITPVWSHSLHVAAFLRTLPISAEYMETVMVTALLHDVIEDVPEFAEKLHRVFPEEFILLEKLDKKGKTTQNYYYQLPFYPIAALVKGSDRIHNLHTMLGAFSVEKIQNYITETEEFVLPMLKIAKREHPEYEACFENMKLFIGTQLSFAREVVKLNGGTL